MFAGIINVLLSNGEQVVKENKLENAIVRYYYKADKGKLHEMERDAAKYWKNSNIRIACFGYENQTMPDIDAPLRGMGYDYNVPYKVNKTRRRDFLILNTVG